MAEVSIPNRVVNWEDLSLNQQFLLAAYRGNTKLVYDLINGNNEESFDPNCYDEKGFTALHAASARGYLEIVRVLLSSDRIKINVLDNMARHPIEIAWHSGCKDIVALIYESMPAATSRICVKRQSDNFVKMLFTSSDDIMGKCFDLSKLREISDKPDVDYQEILNFSVN